MTAMATSLKEGSQANASSVQSGLFIKLFYTIRVVFSLEQMVIVKVTIFIHDCT